MMLLAMPIALVRLPTNQRASTRSVLYGASIWKQALGKKSWAQIDFDINTKSPGTRQL